MLGEWIVDKSKYHRLVTLLALIKLHDGEWSNSRLYDLIYDDYSGNRASLDNDLRLLVGFGCVRRVRVEGVYSKIVYVKDLGDE